MTTVKACSSRKLLAPRREKIESDDQPTTSALGLSPQLFHEPVHESGGDIAGNKVGIIQNLEVYRNSGLDPLDNHRFERALHPGDGSLPCPMMDDQLCYQ